MPLPTTSFLFDPCRAEVDARGFLVVTLPADGLHWRGALATEAEAGLSWCEPEPLVGSRVIVPCEPGVARSYDAFYASEIAIRGESCTFEFRGAVHYGRVPTDRGWALHVIGAPRHSDPDGRIWRWYAAVEISRGDPPTRDPVHRAPPVRPGFIEAFHDAMSAGATVAQALRKARAAVGDLSAAVDELLRAPPLAIASAAEGRR